MHPDRVCVDLPDVWHPTQWQNIHFWNGGTNTVIGKRQWQLKTDSKPWKALVLFTFPKFNLWQRWKIWFNPKICVQVSLDQTHNCWNKRPVLYFETIWLRNIKCKQLYNEGNLICNWSTYDMKFTRQINALISSDTVWMSEQISSHYFSIIKYNNTSTEINPLLNMWILILSKLYVIILYTILKNLNCVQYTIQCLVSFTQQCLNNNFTF